MAIAARLLGRFKAKTSSLGLTRSATAKLANSFVSNGIDEEAFDGFQGGESPRAIVTAGIATAIGAMSTMPVNSGQESIFFGKMVPWFESLPKDPDECLAKVPDAYYEFGDYLEFMSLIIDTGVNIVEEYALQAKFVQELRGYTAFLV